MSNENISIVGAQIRAARGLVNITGDELAKRAGIGLATLWRAEAANEKTPNLTKANLAAIRRALEDAGVEFLPGNGGGAGVRLRKR